MAKISSYPSDANVTTSDRLIGSDNENSNETKNFEVGDIITLAESIIGPNYVPYTGATGNVDLGVNALTSSQVSVNGVVPLAIGGSVYFGNVILGSSGILDSGLTTSIGDYYSNQNGTIITVDDNLQKITFVGGFDIDNGQGTAGQVLTSQGSGATPEWTSLSGTYVPYTGATANVNLGTNTIIASQGDFPTIYASYIYPTVGFTSIYIGDDNPLSPGGGLLINTTIKSYGLGDVFALNNSTTIFIDDISQIISFVGAFNLSNGLGTAGQVLTSQGSGTTPEWTSLSAYSSPYLSAHSALQQTATLINTAYAMKFNTVDISNNISISNDGLGNPTRIAPAESGVYNIQFSAQIQRSSGGSSATIDIWFRQGGVDIPNSNTSVNVQANAGFLVAAWNFYTFIDVDLANPYVEIMWATTDTDVSLQQAASNAVHPATPSVILTVNKVSA